MVPQTCFELGADSEHKRNGDKANQAASDARTDSTMTSSSEKVTTGELNVFAKRSAEETAESSAKRQVKSSLRMGPRIQGPTAPSHMTQARPYC